MTGTPSGSGSTPPETGPPETGPPETGPPETGPRETGRRNAQPGLMIARVLGIPVYVSPYWIFIAALLVYLYANSLDSNVRPEHVRYLVSAAFVVLLYASVLVHEMSHCVVARAFGLAVRRVLLYPLGGFSEIEQEPPTPGQEFAVSAAGPVISLVLALIAALLSRVVTAGLPNLLIDQLFRANLLVGIFNLLPGLPLDGGRIFRAGIWRITRRTQAATIAAAWAGRVIAVAIILLPLALSGGRIGSLVTNTYWLWLVFVAAFMWVQSGQAIRAARVRERLPQLRARTLARRAIPVRWNLPLSEAIRQADEAQARALVVVDSEAQPIAIVDESAVTATPPARRPWVEVGTVARTLQASMVLAADLSGMELIDAVRRANASEYLLVEPSGQVYGVLTASDLSHAFAGT